MGLWFAVFPTVETLAAQALARRWCSAPTSSRGTARSPMPALDRQAVLGPRAGVGLLVGLTLASSHGSTDRVKINHGQNTKLTADRLRELAPGTGAEVTIKRLRAEMIAIERAFPELRLQEGRRAVPVARKRLRAYAQDALKRARRCRRG